MEVSQMVGWVRYEGWRTGENPYSPIHVNVVIYLGPDGRWYYIDDTKVDPDAEVDPTGPLNDSEAAEMFGVSPRLLRLIPILTQQQWEREAPPCDNYDGDASPPGG